MTEMAADISSLDCWRYLIVLMCGASVVMACIAIVRAIKRWRQGARRVCVPLRVIILTLLTLILACSVAALQLLYWIHTDQTFAWFRSPLVFAVVLLTSITLLQLINFIYPNRRDVHRNTADAQNL